MGARKLPVIDRDPQREDVQWWMADTKWRLIIIKTGEREWVRGLVGEQWGGEVEIIIL